MILNWHIFFAIQRSVHEYFICKLWMNCRSIDLAGMAYSHQYSVEDCGRKQKLQGPGGEGAICEFCAFAFSSTNECNRHIEMDKHCWRKRRQLRRKVRERVQQQMANADDDSGISMEEEDERIRLQPLRIKINLAKKEVVTSDEKSVESSKNEKQTKAARSYVEAVDSYVSERVPRIESRSDSTAPMVKIKEEILSSLSSIKNEPVEDVSQAKAGIRVALEKTKGRRYSVAFTSSVPSSEIGFDQTSVGGKVSKKNRNCSRTQRNRDEPASKPTNKKSQKESTPLKSDSGDKETKCKDVKAGHPFRRREEEQSEPGRPPTQDIVPDIQQHTGDRLQVDVDKSVVFHLAEGSLKPVLPDHLKGFWVAFDSTFLTNFNTVFCFRLTQEGQVN